MFAWTILIFDMEFRMCLKLKFSLYSVFNSRTTLQILKVRVDIKSCIELLLSIQKRNED